MAENCPLPEGFSQVLSKEGVGAKTPILMPESIKVETKKGRAHAVSLVNLWAIWCPPCLKELPMLDSIANNPDFSIETIHLGDNLKEIEARFNRLNIKHLPKRLEADLTLLSQWGFQGLPATLVFVDRKVAYRHQGYIHQSAKALANWLSCLAISSPLDRE